MKKLRLSLIDFLNAVPLQWGFMHGSVGEEADLLFDVPSQCAAHLASGQADVGLIPVIEYQRIPGLQVIPGISIASKCEVKSVLFVSRRPIESVETVAVDTSSRTSAALLRILLCEFFDNPEVRFQEAAPEPQQMLRDQQAALLIGNPALHVETEGLHVYDLANLWYRFTGLPFVFAFWAFRQEVEIDSRVSMFYDSRNAGLRDIERISQEYAGKLGLPEAEIRSYLNDNLDYSLDQSNLKGLQLFFELAMKWRLIDRLRPLLVHGAALPDPELPGGRLLAGR